MKPNELIAGLSKFRETIGNTDVDDPNAKARFCSACACTVRRGTTTCTANAHIPCPLNLSKSSAHT
jgi:hypothetical protein